MAFTSEQLTTLETAIAAGTLSIKLNGREITYQSLDQMLRLRDIMAADVAKTAGGSKSGSIQMWR